MLNTSFGSSQRTGHTEGGSFDVIHTNNGGGLDGQVTGRWRAAYRFSLLEIKRKWLCDWLGHKAWGKGSYLSEGTHHLQWCGMQEENRLSSGRGNIPFWSVTLKMPTDRPRDRSACLLDQEKWCITEAWDLFLYRWYLKSRKPSMGSRIPSLCLTLEQPKHASWHVLLLLPEIPFSHIFIFLPSQYKEISARSPPLRSLPWAP